MSFWERLKPAQMPPAVVQMEVTRDGTVVRLLWEDGKKTAVTARTLRQTCPCAACVDEWTHQRTFDPSHVPAGVTCAELTQVGNYALRVLFSDQHSTGIFNWSYLRDVSERVPAPS